MSFAVVLADLKEMLQTYLDRPVRSVQPAACDPYRLTEADIRNWDIFFLSTDFPPLVTEEKIQKWSAATRLGRNELYDCVAIYLARGFHRSELDFEFCDEVVNELHGVIMQANEDRPELYWSVFLAFDSGEFYPNNDRSRDPVETYTRPLIAEVVERYSREYPNV